MTPDDIVGSIVDAVAATDGLEPEELEPLYEYVDASVFETLYDQESAEWSFTFQYSDHQVTLTHEGEIIVDGRVHTSDARA